MALANVFARLDELEKNLNTTSRSSVVSEVSVDMSGFENRLSALESLTNKVSELEANQLPGNLPSKVTELEALASKLPEFNQRLQKLEASIAMIVEHVKSLDIPQLKTRIEALENKDA